MFNPIEAIFGTVGKITEVVDKVVIDKDAKIQLEGHLEQLKQQVYVTELNTKTVPWVDALHKMGRQIISLITLIGVGALVYLRPELDPLTLMAMTGPAGIYNYAKGRGK